MQEQDPGDTRDTVKNTGKGTRGTGRNTKDIGRDTGMDMVRILAGYWPGYWWILVLMLCRA